MSPAIQQPHVIAQFRQLIWQALDTESLPTALFVAERLLAYDPKSADSVHIHAVCLYRDGQYQAALHVAKNWSKHVGCAYVYAQCCLKLGGGKESEGVSVLEGCRRQWTGTSSWSQHSDTERRAVPDAASITFLIGKLWHALGDIKKAVEAYVVAVKINPFLWEAFIGLCETGVNLRVNNIFKPTAEMLESLKLPSASSLSVSGTIPEENASVNGLRNASENLQNDPFSSSNGGARDRDLAFNNHPSFFNRLNEGLGNIGEVETPTAQSSNPSSHEMLGGGNMNAIPEKPPPVRKTRATTTEITARKLSSRNTREISDNSKRSTTTTTISQESTTTAAPARRSTRLTSKFTSKLGVGAERETRLATKEREREAKKIKSTGSRSRSLHISSGTGAAAKEREKERDKGGNSEDVNMTDAAAAQKPIAAAPTVTLKPLTDSKKEEAMYYVLDLFKKLGTGYFSLSRFHCKDALQILSTLPTSQKETPWVQSAIGRAQYEMANYADAERSFLKVRQLDPVRTKDMEVFSTILWHQRKDVELSYLAHELVELDRLSPESWCALGNCFSLQRDHDQALKCFKRATQLNPKLAYAFTLQGHEHVSNEEYEKALSSYRSAIAADSRHYNAWYGLGKVFEKMGKYDIAEKHFRTATKINPTNAVLVCCVGMVLEKTKDYTGALGQYKIACEMAPGSALSRFKKARTLMSLKMYPSALNELKILKDIAPDEANVHFLLGKLYKLLKDKKNAIKHFTDAMNLDPKAGHLIKDAIENLDDDDDSYSAEDPEVNRFLDH
ncbi:uncharacterized protein LAJ45_02740 [Morchella importuna]|uniref:uncharacterized protein n=1 Tax=Morchella importuna TaxID=1174673 RepID=UPI001E8E8435|nr:uncharacterized protein LAJ45_02740 [Morchella importuna]KAH8153153.1 hypothetical protein LAJ45_02740 [Morchella importuna]